MLAVTPRRSGPRILIVRLSALGDAIHGLPVACALRHSMPNATIGWVVEGRTAELLEGHPAIDHVIRTSRGWLKSPRAVLDLRRRLKGLRFDIAIDLQCLTKSAIAARLSGARRRMGMAGEDGREASRWLHNDLVEVAGEHVIDRYLSMLRPLGIKAPAVRFDLPELPADASTASRFLAAEGLVAGRFAILNPGAGWPSKIWPAERYGEVARRLAGEHGLPSVAVWGGAAEKPLGEAIVAASGGAARLAPSTTVSELAALCRRAGLFLGSDTGPMHLAVAVGTPTASMHGTSQGQRCGAYGSENIRLQVRYHAGSSRERRRADNAAMREISVGMAVEACGQLLARATRRVG
jgi:lipopolysaccharide heptosyltransferase I